MKNNIPNILTGVRLLMIGLFVVLFFKVGHVWALAVFLLAGVTDVLDGYLARKYGWITPLGKILDPIADKSMQSAVLLSFTLSDYIPFALMIPFVVKELAQAGFSVAMFRYRKVVTVSRWYGKVAACLFYLAVSVTILIKFNSSLPSAFDTAVTVLWLFTLLWMLFAFVSYLVCYAKMASQMKKEWKGNALRGE